MARLQKHLSGAVWEARRVAGCGREEAARRAGISAKTIERYETGERTPEPDEEARIIRAIRSGPVLCALDPPTILEALDAVIHRLGFQKVEPEELLEHLFALERARKEATKQPEESGMVGGRSGGG